MRDAVHLPGIVCACLRREVGGAGQLGPGVQLLELSGQLRVQQFVAVGSERQLARRTVEFGDGDDRLSQTSRVSGLRAVQLGQSPSQHADRLLVLGPRDAAGQSRRRQRWRAEVARLDDRDGRCRRARPLGRGRARRPRARICWRDRRPDRETRPAPRVNSSAGSVRLPAAASWARPRERPPTARPDSPAVEPITARPRVPRSPRRSRRRRC